LSEHSSDAISLVEEVRPETRYTGYFISKIDITQSLQRLLFLFWSNFIKYCFEFIIFQKWIIDPMKFSMDAKFGGFPEDMCRSDAFCSSIKLKNASILAIAV
jgi:hypothetical protein